MKSATLAPERSPATLPARSPFALQDRPLRSVAKLQETSHSSRSTIPAVARTLRPDCYPISIFGAGAEYAGISG